MGWIIITAMKSVAVAVGVILRMMSIYPHDVEMFSNCKD